MNSKSVFFKIGMSFIVIYGFLTVLFSSVQLWRHLDRINENNIRTASNYLKIGRILLKDGEVQDLMTRLDESVETRQIGFYYLTRGREEIAYSNAAGTDDNLLFADLNQEGSYETEYYRYHLIVENGFKLIVGHKTALWAQVSAFFSAELENILKDIGTVTVCTILLLLYSFRDFRTLIAQMRRRGVNRSDLEIARSSETLTLVRGIKGYEDSVDHLKKENLLLRGQILPALQKELHSGRMPPYEFGCAMVRTDINNFTSIFSNHDRTEFMSRVNAFFIEATHVVSRYKGFVYEFVGDEVIYYFKDEDHENACAIALSAIRDINAIADRFHSESSQKEGYSFKIKSSIAFGTLRFGPLVNGFALAGSPLIETVRILSHVHEKSDNIVIFDEKVADRVGHIAATKPFGVVMLKGLSAVCRLYVYQGHVALTNHLRQENPDRFAMVKYYRSDRHLVEVLQYIKGRWLELEKEDVLSLLAGFREARATQSSTEVRSVYVDLLEGIKREVSGRKNESAEFILAVVISSAACFFNQEDLKGRMRELLLDCLSLKSRRVVANVIEVFSELDPTAKESVFDEILNSTDNRILANLIVKEGKMDWSNKARRQLNDLLKTSQAHHRASGFFALGEIGRYLKEEDEVAFNADFEMQRFLKLSERAVADSHPMVRRQAIGALLKTGQAAKLMRMAQDRSKISQEIRNEILSSVLKIGSNETLLSDAENLAPKTPIEKLAKVG